MADFKCDSCQKAVSEKDKYKLRCSGECRRYFCMNCTGLDKATTKVLYHQKYHNIRFFCSVCDSPTLKYLHDKITHLHSSQIPIENVEALGACLKKNNDLLPVITEIYDTLSSHDSRWNLLYKKIDDIHSQHTGLSDNGQESLFKSIREMKQDIFNLTSVFMDNHDESVKIQVHDSSKNDLIKEIGDLRKNVNQMSLVVERLAAKDKPNIRTTQLAATKTISTQTDTHHKEVATPVKDKVATPVKVKTPLLYKTTTKEEWYYMIVSKIPSQFTSNQIAHYVKEKLRTTDFVRCFQMLKNNNSSLSDFKIGVKDRKHFEHLKDISMWPPGTSINTGMSSVASLNLTSPAHATSTTSHQHLDTITAATQNLTPGCNSKNRTRENKSIKIGSDGEAIAACKSHVLQSNCEINVEKNMSNGFIPNIDPMTPPIVRMTRDSDAADGRYLLARLRDPSILKALRLYLAYLHDQPSNVCFEGYTTTSIKLALASEGLPSDVDSLRKLYYRFHNAYGIGLAEVEADLSAFRSFFSSEKIQQLQKTRESHSKYFSVGSPSKNKNF